MEYVTKKRCGSRSRISGNTDVGHKRYSDCVANEIKRIKSDKEYARKSFERLGLYNSDGSFKGDFK